MNHLTICLIISALTMISCFVFRKAKGTPAL